MIYYSSNYLILDNFKENSIMNNIKSNIDKLVESGKIKLFATKHNGAWTHKDWLEFCKELEGSEFMPLDLNKVGQLLEKEKKLIESKRENTIETINPKNQNVPKEDIKVRKIEKKQRNEKETKEEINTLPELIQTHLPSLKESIIHNISSSESSIIETGYKFLFAENFITLYNEMVESVLTACTKVNELNLKYYEKSLNLLLKNNEKK